MKRPFDVEGYKDARTIQRLEALEAGQEHLALAIKGLLQVTCLLAKAAGWPQDQLDEYLLQLSKMGE